MSKAVQTPRAAIVHWFDVWWCFPLPNNRRGRLWVADPTSAPAHTVRVRVTGHTRGGAHARGYSIDLVEVGADLMSLNDVERRQLVRHIRDRLEAQLGVPVSMGLEILERLVELEQ